MDQFDYKKFLTSTLDWLINDGLPILVALILAYVLWRVSKVIIARVFKAARHRHDDLESVKRLNTLENFVKVVASAAIFIVLGIVVLRECGIEIGPILAAAGVLGLAVSFGAQHLVQDVISGFFILYDNQIREGDIILVNGVSGTVERMNLRLVALRCPDGSFYYIRSGQLGPITNLTQDFSYYVFELGVSYDSNVEQVFEIIRETSDQMMEDPAMKYVVLENVELFGLDRFDASALVIKGRIKTTPQQRWAVGREFNRRIKLNFDRAGIDIPFPQRTIHIENVLAKTDRPEPEKSPAEKSGS